MTKWMVLQAWEQRPASGRARCLRGKFSIFTNIILPKVLEGLGLPGSDTPAVEWPVFQVDPQGLVSWTVHLLVWFSGLPWPLAQQDSRKEGSPSRKTPGGPAGSQPTWW